MTGLWFQTSFIFHIIYAIILPIDYVSRWLKPPTRISCHFSPLVWPSNWKSGPLEAAYKFFGSATFAGWGLDPKSYNGCVIFSIGKQGWVTGWSFGTFFILPYIGNNHPNWLILFGGVETTKQVRVPQLWRTPRQLQPQSQLCLWLYIYIYAIIIP